MAGYPLCSKCAGGVSRPGPLLSDQRLRVHRGLLAVELALIAVLLCTYFMKWHALGGSALDGMGCAFMPDCKPSAPSPPSLDRTDTGYDHHSIVVPLWLLGLALLLGLSWRAPRRRITFSAAIIGLLATLAYVALQAVDLSHLFENALALPAAQVYDVSMFALLAAALACAVAQPILFFCERVARERSALPPAHILDR